MSEMSEKPTLELMKQYNELTVRYKDARAWDNNPKTTIEEKHKFADKLASLIHEMSELSEQIKSLGYEITEKEYFEGFKQPEEFRRLGGKL